jgi:diamine N-acetyltransferase
VVVSSNSSRRSSWARAHQLRALTAWAFDEAGAHRVWLDVKDANARAQALYESEGFVREGVLRETLREDDGTWSSLVLMVQLETDRHRTA